MATCLITGYEGFIGSHLAPFLLSLGHDVTGSIRPGDEPPEDRGGRPSIVECDVADKAAVDDVMRATRPDVIFHLAAQSRVIPSWQDPAETLKTNVLGTMHVLEAVRQMDIDPVVAVACSSAEYGLSYPSEIPIVESKEFRPSSPYAVSKIGTDMLAYIYAHAMGMKTIRVRLFNITGPGKTQDACSDFAEGIVEVEKGHLEFLPVGNLEGVRDITDVRDAIRALWLLAERGTSGEVYNVCSGKGIKVKDLVDTLLSLSDGKVKVRHEDARMRPLDDPIFIGDDSRIKELGWKPDIGIEKTLSDMLDHWRKRL